MMKDFIKKRILSSPIRKNVVANLFGVGVNLLNQVVLVPFYILCWGKDLYADWIVITAVTAFFSMSDIGLNNVIQNRFAIKFAENDLKECNKLITINIFIVSIIFLVALLFSISYICVFDFGKQVGLHILSRKEAGFVFIMLLVHVFLGMYSGIESAIYRASRRTAQAVYFDQFAKLAYVGIIFACLFTKTPIAYMVILMCLPNFILIFVKHIIGKEYFLYKFHFSDMDFGLIKKLFVPSVSFLSFPLGNAIILQGYTLLVNKFFGVDAVVLFNTTRTLTNFAKTLLSTIQQSVWPEYSVAYGKKDYSRMRLLYHKTLKTAIIGVVVIIIGLMMFGPYIYEIWTHRQVIFSYELMIAFLVVLFFYNFWVSGSVTLMATNNHMRLGVLFVLSAAISLSIAYFIVQKVQNLSLVVYTMLFMHLTMVIYTAYSAKKILKEK